jgi:hypothetical protein
MAYHNVELICIYQIFFGVKRRCNSPCIAIESLQIAGVSTVSQIHIGAPISRFMFQNNFLLAI